MSSTNEFLTTLAEVHQTDLPKGELISGTPDLIHGLLAFLFPIRAVKRCISRDDIEATYRSLKTELVRLIRLGSLPQGGTADGCAQSFLSSLPRLRELLKLDAEAMFKGDPAAKSVEEVIICYPGFLAIGAYRIANTLHTYGLTLLPRVITEFAHRETGIDIHPGAKIGESFCIDHGSGLVIGETSVIKNNVRIYQGVTLGGLAISKDMANKKRHPTIEENVVIYANATILGGDTIIGANSTIGGNVWITSSVEPNSKIYHKSEVGVKKPTKKQTPVKESEHASK